MSEYYFRDREGEDRRVDDLAEFVDQDAFMDETRFRAVEVYRHVNHDKATNCMSLWPHLKVQTDTLSVPAVCLVEELPPGIPRSEPWMNFGPDPKKQSLWWVYAEQAVDVAQKDVRHHHVLGLISIGRGSGCSNPPTWFGAVAPVDDPASILAAPSISGIESCFLLWGPGEQDG